MKAASTSYDGYNAKKAAIRAKVRRVQNGIFARFVLKNLKSPLPIYNYYVRILSFHLSC